MIKASIIGATGYTGIELIRILSQHPQVQITHLTSSSQAGENLSDIYPQFSGNKDITLEEYDPDEIVSDTDVAFTALPHGVSQNVVADLFQKGIKVIDLSGDFRYKDREIYEKWYDIEHKHSELLADAVYGLVEINRDQIKSASLIANPGCYPTASTLGLLPLIKEDVVDFNSIIIDAKSGVSGAGKSLKRVTHFAEADESMKAYGITTHRHTSEIESNLENFSGEKDIKVSFTPHLTPMKRGILSTIYININQDIKNSKLNNMYKEFYNDSKFVQVLENSSPDTKYLAGTNYCHLGINRDKRMKRVVVTSAIDNLGKGAAGQAVQNMNVMFGLNEEVGLEATGVFP